MKDPRYPYALDIGTEVCGYRILEVLGAGGFGITYKAFNDVTHKTVAIKEFYVRDLASRSGSTVLVDTAISEGTYEYALQKFQDEAKAVVNRLSHPYVVKGENFLRWNNTCYLVMEYVEGVTLEQWLIGHAEPPDEAGLRPLFEKIFDAVDHVHDADTMHRDLTPRNIMVRPNGDPLLIDFGAAGQGLDRERSAKTVAQMRYAPPEQADIDLPARHGRYTDIYSLGAVLYRAVTGAPPVASVNRIMRMGRAGGSGDPYLPVAEAVADPGRYSVAFLNGIDQALRIDERERPQSIAALREALGWTREPVLAVPAEAERPAILGVSPATAGPEPAPDGDVAAPAVAPSDSARAAPAAIRPQTVTRPGQAPAAGEGPKRRAPIGLIAAALAGLLVVGGVLFSLFGSKDDPGPAPGTYGFVALRDGSAVRLIGFAPGEAERQAFQDAVVRGIAGIQVTSEVKVAPGAPAGYAETVRQLLGGLADLSSGSVKVQGRDAVIDGAAISPEGYARLMRDFARPLPGGWQARLSVRAPAVASYRFQIDLDPGRVAISGFVPDEAVQARILDAVRRAVPGQAVHDETRIASGNGPAFVDLALFGAGKLAELSLGRVTVAGDELQVDGRARSTESYAVLKSATVPAGRLVSTIRPPLVQPFDLAFVIEGDRLAVTGYVPNEEAKSAVSAAAKRAAGGRTVRDDTQIADGAPPDFLAAVRFAADLTPRLVRGRIALSGKSLTVDGQVASPGDFMVLSRALQVPVSDRLPPGFVIDRNSVSPPLISPYVWTATLGAGGLKLAGYVPSEAVRQDLAAAATAALGTTPIQDDLQIAEGAPPAFPALARLALAQLPRLGATVRLAIEDGKLTVEGTATSPDAYAAAMRDLGKTLPGNAVGQIAGLIPAGVSPFTWNADANVARLRLGGYVASEAQRTALVEAARKFAPQGNVVDQMLIAAGAPAGFGDAALYALSRMADTADPKASVTGRDVRLEGRARSFDAFMAALQKNREPVPGGGTLIFEVRPPAAAPYEWSATADGQALVLSGFVPSAEARTELADLAARVGRGRTVRDETRVADGAPAEFMAAARFLTGEAGRLMKGRASLRDQAAALDGQAYAPSDYEDLRRSGTALPAGFRQRAWAIEPAHVAPFAWTVAVARGAVRLTGFVPSEAARRDIAGAGTNVFGDGAVKDETLIAAGAPEAFAGMARWALNQAGRLAEGRITVEDGNIAVEGTVATPEAHAALLRDLARPPPGSGIARTALTPAPVAAYQFGAELTGTRVRFTGYVPDNETRLQLIETLRRNAPNLTVADDTRPAGGAPTGFAETLAAALADFGDLGEARLTLADGVVRLNGRARSGEAFQALAAVSRSGVAGLRFERSIRPPLAAPFDWALSIDPGAITVTGSVPDAAVRTDLAAALAPAAGGRSLKDETRIADGAPPAFAEAVRFAAELAPRLARGRITLSERNLTIDGQSLDPDAFEALRAAVNGPLPADFRLLRFSVNAPVVSPYTWQMTRSGGEIRLTGYVPAETLRRDLLAAAGQVAGARVVDDLQVGDGAPDRFAELARTMTAQAARLEAGTVALRDSAITVDGTAATPEGYAAVLQDLGGWLPGGAKARLDLKPARVAPYVWNAKVERWVVRLTGFVPSDEERKRVIEGLKASLPRGIEIRDDTRIAAGAGPDFEAALRFAIRRAGELADGTLSISDASVKVAGTARNADSFRAYNEAIRVAALPDGVLLDSSVEAPRGSDKAPTPAPVRTERPAVDPRPTGETRPTPDRQPVDRQPADRQVSDRPPGVDPRLVRPNAPVPPAGIGARPPQPPPGGARPGGPPPGEGPFYCFFNRC